MDNFVITIARQYGSGGRTIGEELAKKLGISYYDKDIIRMASEESGIHEQLFGRADENVSTKQRFFAKSGIYKGELIPPQSKDFTSDENLFNYQAKVIRQLAENRVLCDHRTLCKYDPEGLFQCSSCVCLRRLGFPYP